MSDNHSSGAGPVMITTFPLNFIFFSHIPSAIVPLANFVSMCELSHSQVARLDIFPLRKLLRRGGVDNLSLAHDVDVVSHL